MPPRDVAFDHALAKFSDVLDQPLQDRRSLGQVVKASAVEHWSVVWPDAFIRFSASLQVPHRPAIHLSCPAEQIGCGRLLGLTGEIVGQVADNIRLADWFKGTQHSPAMDLTPFGRFIDDN